MHDRWLLADVFHDVDFAAGRPAFRLNVLTQHPEGGPYSLAAGDLDARLEASIGLLEFPLCLEPGGGVAIQHAVPIAVGFVARSDDQVAILQLNVLQMVGVVLQFVVAPAIAAGLDRPRFGPERPLEPLKSSLQTRVHFEAVELGLAGVV